MPHRLVWSEATTIRIDLSLGTGAHERIVPDAVGTLARYVEEEGGRYPVRVEVQGETLGCISRDEAEDVQPLLQLLDAQGRPAWVKATVVGGWVREDSRGSFGIELDDLPDEDEL